MMKFLRLSLAICMAASLHFNANSQSLSINTTGAAADPSAILDVSSTLKGVLVPRMDKTQKNAIASPATGLLIYQTAPDSLGFQYYDGAKWVWLSNNSPILDTINWKTHGNSGLADATSFLGNIDNIPINFRINNQKVGRFDRSRLNYSIGRGAGNDLGVGHVSIGDSAGSAINNNFPGVYIGFRSGLKNTGTNNTFVGSWSGQATTSGSSNAFFGTDAGFENTTGYENTFLGHFAGLSNKTGFDNVAVGLQAANTSDTAAFTTFIGTFSGYYNRNHYNTAVGGYSLTYNNFTSGSNSTGAENTALGYGAGYRINLGSQNVAVGYQSMNSGGGPYISGNRNVAVGDSTLFTFSSGNDNVAMGYKALSNAQTGSQSVAIGSRALRVFSGTYPNTAIGYSSLDSAVTNGANTAVGSYTLTSNKTGINNTAIGDAAMYESAAGNNNTAVGNDAGRKIKADFNTAVGASALNADTTGTYNTAVGFLALNSTTKGVENVGIGVQSDLYGDSTSYTTAVGTNAAYYNRRNNTTAIGHGALFFNSYGNNSFPYISTNLAEGKSNTAVGFQSGYYNNQGSRNTSLGYRANIGPAIFNAGAIRNVAIGDSALANNLNAGNTAVGSIALGINNGLQNTAIGDSAMALTTRADQNEAMGFNALKSLKNVNAAGYWNTAIGGQSMEYDTSAYATVAVGFRSLRNAKKVSESVAIGVGAMEFGDSTYYNTAVGRGALFNFGSGVENTAVGAYAMSNKKEGYYNTAVGDVSLEQDSSGIGNTGIGTSAFRSNKKSYDNVGVGLNAGYWSLGNGINGGNVFVGNYSGQGVSGQSIGTYNIAMGYRAYQSFTTGSSNVALGDYALSATTTGSQNVGIGESALGANKTGNLNVVVGAGAKDQSTSGNRNVALGFWADRGDSSGNNNVTIGHVASYFNGNRSNIVAIGDSALHQNGSGVVFANTTNGLRNTAVGSASLRFNTNGYNNTATGFNTLYASNSGISNTAFGNNALRTTSGTGNTGVGDSALYANLSGSNNTALGYNTDNSAPNLSNATAIGANAFAGASNSMVLGSITGINNATATTSVGVGTNTPGARLHVRRNGASGGTFIANPSMIIEDNTQSYVQLSNPTASENGILSGNAVTSIRSGIVFGIDSAVFLRAGGNFNRMIIDNNGYIGVGTTAPYPSTQFHLYEPLAANVNLRIAGSSLSSVWEPGLELVKTTAAGSDWKVRVSSGGSLVYSRGADDFATTPTDYYQMSTASFIPTTTNINSLGSSANLWTSVWATSGVVSTSDERFKENITNLNYGLQEIMKLRPVSFNWKENPQWGKKIGFIAQEVQPVLKEVVQVGDIKTKTEAKDDNGKALNANSDKLGIYYSDIIPVTVKAIQEQQQLIIKQQKTIDELKAQNELILKRLEKLENK
jgi:trimeric autotransporter adhesin